MPDIDEDRKRVPDHRSDLLKGSLPQGPPVHPRSRNMEDLRVEMKQLREVVLETMWMQMRAILY